MALTADPYTKNARKFNDVLGIPLRTIQMQRLLLLMVGGSLSIAVIALSITAAVLADRLHNAPLYAFGFDRTRVTDRNGNTISESAIPINIQSMDTPDARLHEADVEYWLPNFVETLFSVSTLDDDKRNILRGVRPFVAPGSAAEKTIEDYLTTYNPVIRSQNQHVVVTADPIPPARYPNVYHVTWTARTTDLDDRPVGQPQRQGALVTVAWGKPSITFEKDANGNITGGNPPGMYVTQIVSDKPLDPHATNAGGDSQ